MIQVRLLIAAAVAALVVPASVSAGPALDAIVNCYKLDVDSGAKDMEQWSSVVDGSGVGQTFRTGPETILIGRIAVCVAGWNKEWTDGESLVLTLWDSPSRTRKLASYAMPYKWRNWEGATIMYPLNAKVKPSTEYFFELTVKGGDGKIEGLFHSTGDYSGGRLYIGGKPAEGDLAFETHVKHPWDRNADYSYYFSQWNLDYPGLERVKAAVAAKDWDRATRELVNYYNHRTDLFEPMTPKHDPSFDRRDADMMVNMEMKDSHGDPVYLGPDWNFYIWWPLRGGVGLTRTGIRNTLARGYVMTGDEKYARAFNQMTLCRMRDQPSPLRAGAIKNKPGINPAPAAGIRGGSMWSALAIGARMSNMWYFYSEVATSKSLTTDARAALIFNMVDMANVQELYRGGGNWEAQRADSLLEFGQAHPELKRSKVWFSQGLETLIKNSEETVFPDGALHECSMNYHGLVTNRFLQLLENARKNNFPVPESFKHRVEKMIEFMMYSSTWLGPNLRDKDGGWRTPATGDTFGPFNARDYFDRGSRYYGRKDFLWMLTDGKQGVAPAHASVEFPASGWFIMRSGWDHDARFMHLHNGKNEGHGHNDELQIVVSAFGRELLVDPGIYVYGTKEAAEVSRTSAHSTISVDGRDTILEAGTNTWRTGVAFDSFDGTNAGYEGLSAVRHRRRVVFVKPDYWVVLDEVTGPGSHTVESRFVCAEGVLEVHGQTGVFNDGKAGLVIASPVEENVTTTQETGRRPAPGDVLNPIPVLKKTIEGALPVRMVQALVPFKGTLAPEVTVTSQTQPDGDIVVSVSIDGRKNTVVFKADGETVVDGATNPGRPA